MKTGGDFIGLCSRELNALAGGRGTMTLAGVGLTLGFVLGQSGFSIETDSADLLDLESRDLMLLATFEYDLVMGLESLNLLGFGSLMVGMYGCKWEMGRCKEGGLQRQNNAKQTSKKQSKLIILQRTTTNKRNAPKQGYPLQVSQACRGIKIAPKKALKAEITKFFTEKLGDSIQAGATKDT